MDYQDVIVIEPGKFGGRPRVSGTTIAVSDVLAWLGAGQTRADILARNPELTEHDIRACQAYAADRRQQVTRDE